MKLSIQCFPYIPVYTERMKHHILIIFFLFLFIPNLNAQDSILTNWNIKPSFKFDVLCLLNTLTADPYYLKYYQDEYDKFKDRLTPEAVTALSELKRKLER